MEAYQMGGAIGLAILLVIFVLVFIPIMGVIMQYIITCWFGQEIDTTMYWTGIGLLAVFGTVLSVKSNDND